MPRSQLSQGQVGVTIFRGPRTWERTHTRPQDKSGSSGTGRMKEKAGRLCLHTDHAHPRDSLETCPGHATG